MLDLPSPDPALEIVVSSQGISKGLLQTEGPQVVARPELAIGSLVLLGYYKNLDGPADGEARLGVGFRHRLGGIDLAASALYKHEVHGAAGADRSALELSAFASRRFGPLTPRLGVTWSPDDLGGTRASLYVEGGATLRLFAGASLSANLARRSRDGAPDYTAFNAGASYELAPHFTADLHYYGTAQGRLGASYRSRLVASVRLHF